MTYYKPGSHSVICDRTGYKMKAEDVREEWNGAIVDKRVWEERHPQDFLRSIPDYQAVENARPESTDRFLSVNQVTADNLDQIGSADSTAVGVSYWDDGQSIWDDGASVWD